jgi:hypothetical protein
MNGISDALRERVADEYPDLDRLVEVATTSGTRVRRRRRIGATVCVSVAATASVALVGVALDHVDQAGPATTIEPATQGHDQACQRLRNDSSLSGEALRQFKLRCGASQSADPQQTAKKKAMAARHTTPPAESSPVKETAPGWKCSLPADEKFSCFTRNKVSATINWRPVSEYQSWISSPDKGGSSAVVTTRPHGGYFVSIQSLHGASRADLETLAAGLVWT